MISFINVDLELDNKTVFKNLNLMTVEGENR